MNKSFKEAYEEYTHDENGELSLPCCIDEYEGFARYFYNLALQEVREELEYSRISHAKRYNTIVVRTLGLLRDYIDSLMK